MLLKGVIQVAYRTASREYFNSVIEKIRKEGFEFLAWVTMNSSQNRYHVNLFKYAQSSRLFFHAPNKSFLVMLELIEHFGLDRSYSDQKEGEGQWVEDHYEAYWRGDIIYAFKSGEMARDYHSRVYKETGEWPDVDEGWFLIDKFFEDSPFHRHGGGGDGYNCHVNFEPNNICKKQQDLPNADEITHIFGEILRALDGYLYPKFREMQVTCLAPYYTFPDQEEDFWKKFPLQRLRRICSGPLWGSDFPKPTQASA